MFLCFLQGSWAHPARMSVTFRGTAAWTITWKYWRTRCDSDTWRQQHPILWVSHTSWCKTNANLLGYTCSQYSQCLLYIFFQVVTHFTKKTLSSWKSVPMFTSVAWPQPFSLSSLKVSDHIMVCPWTLNIKILTLFWLYCAHELSHMPIYFFFFSSCQVLMAKNAFWLLFQTSTAPKQHAWWIYVLWHVSQSASLPSPRMRTVRWTSATECP